ncbi:MAG TPA: 2-amino-4-hydroxy-6-hydroxymethyldihydropteridine diphosphokinase [Gemmatimonadales bacterium]|nr:2-amino-4-hydroxy-6-hydroxymethyldihydropteridine diphosphokinase [Gemmatimonadales bacterium]
MERVYVALGSNLGDRAVNLELARRGLGRLPRTTVVRASSIEETEPLGGRQQPAYLNQMVLVETALSPRELLAACQAIEREAGRVRAAADRWASRTLDLDIVRFGRRQVNEPGLTIPHPALPERHFWQRELAELDAHDERD